ncbi:MAG: signal peptidase I [Bdellovibrionales bacterium RIFOXYD12_FULL_39_22]|nr:MAG: signal peptidase I [Bdellovibrionales bacterium RIFOXYB1_FULL_39_21]OFZ43256.1 MAG: signal peptidase I [Bdellovibrionales bacterium RIFOXYC12_FULL_39_17]OFZ47994.1 MAG: signal peptidase I [Bdellovibrionales bacterium RIFOXYC1_FULL_39_130]OFZ75774.1 MAG: signal peptidase I [Bdellovibrionales bacterium RIFOXYD1_FULL_39_84]OFZ94264.1 MAG: signal peptidase I [Bdellovibrionales bacterium RIFOXYD12_FULL_39_22]
MGGVNAEQGELAETNTNQWDKKKIIREVRSIILIVVIVFSLRSMFYEPFRIPTGSMIPTFMIGDFILVNKFAYGLKLPFSEMFTNPIYLTTPKDPQRGDIIVFKYPENPDVNYIKRLIGVPGDEIEIIDKVVYINDRPLPAIKFDGQEIMQDMDDKFKEYNLEFFNSETGTHKHVIQQVAGIYTNQGSNIPRFRVPPGKYFAMGDNRDFSADSRFWGFVPAENIKGRALAVWFSLAFADSTVPDSTMKLRWRRIGTVVD